MIVLRFTLYTNIVVGLTLIFCMHQNILLNIYPCSTRSVFDGYCRRKWSGGNLYTFTPNQEQKRKMQLYNLGP